jgi:dimethylaniline monooxygenase (N-oxide forming)
VKIAIVGAGPAGLASAKLALGRGHDITVFEKYGHLGGIWNPHSPGAYDHVRMQTSRWAFHYSDYPPAKAQDQEFLPRNEFHAYLQCYGRHFGIDKRIRYNAEVLCVKQEGKESWLVSFRSETGIQQEKYDRVIVANGELWRSRKLHTTGTGSPLCAKEYQSPEKFAGRKVLVVGGGVSGADIAAEIATVSDIVHWSVRRPTLMLPRKWGMTPNDGCFSYIGRCEVQGWSRDRYIEFLETCMPDYMRQYQSTGLVPEKIINNAIHVNDSAIPAVAAGRLVVKPAVTAIHNAHQAIFADKNSDNYDVIIVCAGYEPPDYSFIEEFSIHDLYEYFFYWKNPSLAVLNTPMIADGYGTACPYFEAIAYWILQVFEGARQLPDLNEMREWCEEAKKTSHLKEFYDCWLHTVRIGIESGQLPYPATDFKKYWHIVSNGVTPLNLSTTPEEIWKPAYESMVDIDTLRCRILASFSSAELQKLVADGQVSAEDALRSESLRSQAIRPGLV